MTADPLHDSILSYLKRAGLAMRFVRVGLIAVGAAFAGVAQFMDFNKDGPTTWQIIGIFATCLVFIGGLYTAIVDVGAPEELEAARIAVGDAREAEFEYRQAVDEYSSYSTDVRRATSLYLAVMAMRQVLERFDQINHKDNGLAEAFIKAAQPFLPQALGFQTHDPWTVGVYRAVDSVTTPGKKELVLAAKLRAADCDIGEARRWPEGTGFIGLSFTYKREIVIENANDSQIKELFALSNDHAREHDQIRYISYGVVPILIGQTDAPWGVAIATSGEINHFSAQEERGVQPIEGVRSLAKMMELGIAVSHIVSSTKNASKT